jgi:hypothetical protein
VILAVKLDLCDRSSWTLRFVVGPGSTLDTLSSEVEAGSFAG